jgi:ABC-type dipeptide/oligopeptide/nickel transport system permease component
LPASGITSVVVLLLCMTGLDFGALRLGRPETAADRLVALIMAFSVAAPAFWGIYVLMNLWTWVTSLPVFSRRPTDQEPRSTQ